MESLLPSEIARLVYGYLEGEKCSEAAFQFLKTSQHLHECYQFYQINGKFSTKVEGLSLLQCLDMLCAVFRIVQNHVSLLENDTVGKYSLAEQLEFLLAAKDCRPRGEDDSTRVSNQVGSQDEDLYSLRTGPRSKNKVTSEKPLPTESSTIFTPFPLSIDDDLDQAFPVPETTSLDSLPGTTRSRRKSPLKSKNEEFWIDNGSINGAPVDVKVFQKPFLEKPELPTKIAESINKALKTPEKARSKGSKAKGKDKGLSVGEQLDKKIKTVVNQMVKDPAFDDVLAEIIGQMDLPNNPPPVSPVKDAQKNKEVPKQDCAPTADYSHSDGLSTPVFESALQDSPNQLTDACSMLIPNSPNSTIKSMESNASVTVLNNASPLTTSDLATPSQSQPAGACKPIPVQASINLENQSAVPSITIPAQVSVSPVKPVQNQPVSTSIPAQASTTQILLPVSEQTLPVLQPEMLQQPLESTSIIVVSESDDGMDSQPQYFTIVPYTNQSQISAPITIQDQNYGQNIIIAKEDALLSQSTIVTENDVNRKILITKMQKRGQFINIAPTPYVNIAGNPGTSSSTDFLTQTAMLQPTLIPVIAPPAKKRSRPPRNKPARKKKEPVAKPQEPMVVEVRILDSRKDAAPETVLQENNQASAAESYQQLVEATAFSADATPVKSGPETANTATSDEVEELDEATKLANAVNSIVNIISSNIPPTPIKTPNQPGSTEKLSNQKLTPDKQENPIVTPEKVSNLEQEGMSVQTASGEVPNLSVGSENMPSLNGSPEKTSDQKIVPEKLFNQIGTISCQAFASAKLFNKTASQKEMPESASHIRKKKDTNSSLPPSSEQIISSEKDSKSQTPANQEKSKNQTISEKVSVCENSILQKVPEIPNLIPENQSAEKPFSCDVPEIIVCNETVHVEDCEVVPEENSTVSRGKLPANSKEAGQFFSKLELENKSTSREDSEKKAESSSALDKLSPESNSVVDGKESAKGKEKCEGFSITDVDRACDSVSRMERVLATKCDSVSPIRVVSNQRQSLSTPRRKDRHVRALDFGTPKNFKDSFKRKANTSPKNLHSSEPFSDRNKKVRRSQLFQSPTLAIPEATAETTWHFASVSETPRNKTIASVGLKTPRDSRVRSITSPLSCIKEDSSLCEDSTVDSPPERPPLTIATRPPVPKLSGGWDRVNGVGLIVQSPKHPTPQKSFDEESNSLSWSKSPQGKLELKSWDSQLRAMLGGNYDGPEPPKLESTPKSVTKKPENDKLSSTPKAKLSPKKRGKKADREKKSPVKKKIVAVPRFKSKNKSPLKVDFSQEVSGTPSKIPVVLNMPEFTPNKGETSKSVLDKISPKKVEPMVIKQTQPATSESDGSLTDCVGQKKRRKRKPKSSEQVIEPTRTSRRIETRKKNKQVSETIVSPTKKAKELSKTVVSPAKKKKESKQTVSPTKEAKKRTGKTPQKETEELQVESPLEKTNEGLHSAEETKEFFEQISTEVTEKPVEEVPFLQETKKLGKGGKPVAEKRPRGRSRKKPLPDVAQETKDLLLETQGKIEDASALSKDANEIEADSLEQEGIPMVLSLEDVNECPEEAVSTFSLNCDDGVSGEGESLRKKRKRVCPKKIEELPKEMGRGKRQLKPTALSEPSKNAKRRRVQTSSPELDSNVKRGRGRPKKLHSPSLDVKENEILPCDTSDSIENAADAETTPPISTFSPVKKKRGRKAKPKKVLAVRESTDDEISEMHLDNSKFIYTVAEIHAAADVSSTHVEPNHRPEEMNSNILSGNFECIALPTSEKCPENVEAVSSTEDKSEAEKLFVSESVVPDKPKREFAPDDKSRRLMELKMKAETSNEVRPVCKKSEVERLLSNQMENLTDKSETETTPEKRNCVESLQTQIIADQQSNIGEEPDAEKSVAEIMSDQRSDTGEKSEFGRQNLAEKSETKTMPEEPSNYTEKHRIEILSDHQKVIVDNSNSGKHNSESKVKKSKSNVPHKEPAKLYSADDQVEMVTKNYEMVSLDKIEASSNAASKATASTAETVTSSTHEYSIEGFIPSKLPQTQLFSGYQRSSVEDYSEGILDLRVRENVKSTAEIKLRAKQDAYMSLACFQKDSFIAQNSCGSDSSEKVVMYAATPERVDFEYQANVQSNFTVAQADQLSNLSAVQNINTELACLSDLKKSDYEPTSKDLTVESIVGGEMEKTSNISDSCVNVSDGSDEDVTETRNNTTGNNVNFQQQSMHIIHTSYDETLPRRKSENNYAANEEYLRNCGFHIEFESENGELFYRTSSVSDLKFLLNIPAKASDEMTEAPIAMQKADNRKEVNLECSIPLNHDISADESNLFDDAILTGRPALAHDSASSSFQSKVCLETPKNPIVEKILAEKKALSAMKAPLKFSPKKTLHSNKMPAPKKGGTRDRISDLNWQRKDYVRRSVSPFPLAKSPGRSSSNESHIKPKVPVKLNKARLGQNFKSSSDTRVSFRTGSKHYDGSWTNDADFKSSLLKGRKEMMPQCSGKEGVMVKKISPKQVAVKLSPQKRFTELSHSKQSPRKRFSEGSTSQQSPQKLTGGKKAAIEWRERNSPPRSPSPEYSKDDNRKIGKEKRDLYGRPPLLGTRNSRDKNLKHNARSPSPEPRHSWDKSCPSSGERRDRSDESPSAEFRPRRDEVEIRRSRQINEKFRSKKDHERSSSPEITPSSSRNQVSSKDRKHSRRQGDSYSRDKVQPYSGDRGDRRSVSPRDEARPYSGDRRDPLRRSISPELRKSWNKQRVRDHSSGSKSRPPMRDHRSHGKGREYHRTPAPEARGRRRDDNPRYSNQYLSDRYERPDSQTHSVDNSNRRHRYENYGPEDRPQGDHKRKRDDLRLVDERTSRSSSTMTPEDEHRLKELGLWNKFVNYYRGKSVSREDQYEEKSSRRSVERANDRSAHHARYSETEDGEVSSANSLFNHGVEADSRSTADDNDVEIKEILSKKRKIEESSDENTSTSILDKRVKSGSIEALKNCNIPEFLSKIHPSEKE